jgi:uncharacterized membrane protein
MAEPDDSRHWRGPFYVNAEDTSIFVRNRYGIGWTVNFGQPVAWLVLLAIIAVPVTIAVLITR